MFALQQTQTQNLLHTHVHFRYCELHTFSAAYFKAFFKIHKCNKLPAQVIYCKWLFQFSPSLFFNLSCFWLKNTEHWLGLCKDFLCLRMRPVFTVFMVVLLLTWLFFAFFNRLYYCCWMCFCCYLCAAI